MQRPANDPAAAVRLVERFLDRLTNDPDGDPAEALALLPRELPAYGALDAKLRGRQLPAPLPRQSRS